jgi:cytochrome c-type biogenesis protein CcmH
VSPRPFNFAQVAACFLSLIAATAFTQTRTSTDADLDARVKALSSELRCLVCQNQTVADSDAPVARDMRDQVRAQLASGKTESEVKQYMTDRFGDFVLYKPAFKSSTLLLWAGPFFALVFGLFAVIRSVRKKQTLSASTAVLTDEERERARALLGGADVAGAESKK